MQRREIGQWMFLFVLLAVGQGCLSNLLAQRQIERDMAHAFESIDQIYRLNTETRNLIDSRLGEQEVKINNNIQMMMRTLAEIESRLDSIQESQGALRSQIEEIRYQTQKKQPDQLPIWVAADDETSTTVVVEGRQLLLDAQRALVRQDFEGARSVFEEFLRQFPVSSNRFEAHMGIAESYYREKQWKEAIAAFDAVEKRYPADPRAPESLIKIAICHQQMGRNDLAILTLEGLMEKYPGWSQIEQASDMLQQLRNKASLPVQPLEESPN